MLRGVAMAACIALAGCASKPEAVTACIEVVANPSLNLYNGSPHAVTLYLFPLEGTLGFQQMRVEELLAGAPPPGAKGRPVPITVSPGEAIRIDETFVPMTQYVGVVVDYYRSPGAPEGTRKVVIPARCGRGAPTLMLSQHDVIAS